MSAFIRFNNDRQHGVWMRDLTIVMPVYNEAECIRRVAQDWLDVLNELGVAFQLLLIDDGSRDRTPEELDTLSGDCRIRVIHKPNEGHGPTILQGCRMACAESQWVFHADSDNEIAATSFRELWVKRADYDFVFGVREGRLQTLGRRLLSDGSRRVVRLFTGAHVADVNAPFRLMRSACLSPLLAVLPPNMFAPNVAITGLALRWGFQVAITPVPCRPRTTGGSSLRIRHLPGIGFRSLMQVGIVFLRNRSKP